MTNAERTYTVTGMSCGHCGAAVELASGRLDVVGSGFSDEDITAAVTGAGYGLADPARNGLADGDAGD
jgi:hypothetical protein